MIQGSIPLPLWNLNNFNENFWFRIDNLKKSRKHVSGEYPFAFAACLEQVTIIRKDHGAYIT